MRKELYEKYQVPLILTGHEHLYARGRMDDKFPVYVVSVAGPYQNAIQFGDWVERAGTSLQLFQEIEVSPREIHYMTKTVTGELYDEFTIQKDKKGQLIFLPNEELGPESLLPPESFEERYAKELVDSWEKDKSDYLNRKK